MSGNQEIKYTVDFHARRQGRPENRIVATHGPVSDAEGDGIAKYCLFSPVNTARWLTRNAERIRSEESFGSPGNSRTDDLLVYHALQLAVSSAVQVFEFLVLGVRIHSPLENIGCFFSRRERWSLRGCSVQSRGDQGITIQSSGGDDD